MKKIISILLLVCVILSCTACDRNNKNNPRYKIMSKWESEYAIMYVINENSGFLQLKTKHEDNILYFGFGLYNRIHAYSGDVYYFEDDYNDSLYNKEKWQCKKMKDDSFVVFVERTTYFEIGQEFVFELVEENIDESEIPYPPEPETLPELPDYDFPYPEKSENESTTETEINGGDKENTGDVGNTGEHRGRREHRGTQGTVLCVALVLRPL